ncbi:MAG: hybrid sensor histidine kinase/response regulator [Balneolaceae bacterium]|nr:hybrid sensor histidine kinase/response regulator [Balneolaceae bacterium]
MKQFHIEEEKFTILIVDDVESNVKLLTVLLKAAGYNILVAYNAEECLRIAQKRQPDLILLDILLPDMMGYEVAQRLHQIKELNTVPIIFITALTEIQDKLKGFDAGGVDYIEKPFHQEEVLARIKTQLSLKQAIKAYNLSLEQLKRQEEEYRGLNQRKKELLHIVSHDIYNPLNGILGLSNHLQAMYTPETEEYQISEIIGESANKLLNLVDKVLYDENHLNLKTTVNKAPSDIEEIVSNVIKMHRPKAILKKIDLISNIKGNHREFLLDQIKIEIILTNLVSNAIKFTPSGGSVTIETEQSGDLLKIKVIDTGIGIPAHMVKRLFNENGSIRLQGTEGDVGVGLGLDVVQNYIALHKGRIFVNSVVDEGTTFSILLPLS